MPAAGPRPGLRLLVVLLPWIWLVACTGGSASVALAPTRDAGTPIYVASNGWHTEVIVEAATLPAGRWPQRASVPSPRYLEVGWGDRDAYPAARLTPGLALQAALVSRGSALRVAGFDEPISERFRGIEVVELRLSKSGIDALAEFIEASHATDAEGRPIRLEPVAAGAGTFYLASGRFHALNTCNAWTARALRAAGLPLWPALALTAHQLMLQVVPLGRLVATDPL